MLQSRENLTATWPRSSIETERRGYLQVPVIANWRTDLEHFATRLTHVPFVPAKTEIQHALSTDQAAVVPAQAGTHNHQGFSYRCPATLLYCGVWVPAFAGTTAGNHCFTSLPRRIIRALACD